MCVTVERAKIRAESQGGYIVLTMLCFCGLKVTHDQWIQDSPWEKKIQIRSKVKTLGKISHHHLNYIQWRITKIPWSLFTVGDWSFKQLFCQRTEEQAEQRVIRKESTAFNNLCYFLPSTRNIRMNTGKTTGRSSRASKEKWLKSVAAGKSLKWLLTWCVPKSECSVIA